MTIYEWKITDLGNGRYGYLWIFSHRHDDECRKYRCGDPEDLLRVVIDPNDLYGDFNYWSVVDGGNNLANLEIPEDWNNYYDRILTYWNKLGSPVLDRKAAGYEAPWFSWADAGFSDDERKYLLTGHRGQASGGPEEEKHELAALAVEENAAYYDYQLLPEDLTSWIEGHTEDRYCGKHFLWLNRESNQAHHQRITHHLPTNLEQAELLHSDGCELTGWYWWYGRSMRSFGYCARLYHEPLREREMWLLLERDKEIVLRNFQAWIEEVRS